MVTASKRLENIKKLHELSKSTFPGDRTSYKTKIENQIKGMIKNEGYYHFWKNETPRRYYSKLRDNRHVI